MNTCVPCFFVCTKTFYNDCICLWHNTDTGCQDPEYKYDEYYKNNNINYYLKIINPSKEFITKLDDYEMILKNTSISADKIRVVREKILKEYQNELHD